MTKPARTHLDPLALARLLRRGGQLDAEQLHHFVSHIVAGCEPCLKTLRQLTEVDPLADEQDRFEEDHAIDMQFGEALEASGALDRTAEAALEEGSVLDTRRSESNDESFPLRLPRTETRATCELLLQRVRKIWSTDSEHAVSLLQLALGIASGLDEQRYGAAHLADLKAKIFAYLGNVSRIGDDLSRADLWFAKAIDHLEQGSGDPLVLASVHDLLASLRRDQQRFSESHAIFKGVVLRYLEAGNQHDAGRALINQATVAQEQGETAEALEVLRRAQGMLSFDVEPRLQLVVLHNRLSLLADSPEGAKEARRVLEENRSLYQTHGDIVFEGRLPWMEGRIALSHGELDQAEALFRLAQKRLQETNSPLTWALASLDLAVILARQMRFPELEELAQSLLETFMSRGLHQSTFATLLLLVRNAQAKKVTVEMLRSTALALRRAPKSDITPAS